MTDLTPIQCHRLARDRRILCERLEAERRENVRRALDAWGLGAEVLLFDRQLSDITEAVGQHKRMIADLEERLNKWAGDASGEARAFVLRTEPASPSRPSGLQSTIAEAG